MKVKQETPGVEVHRVHVRVHGLVKIENGQLAVVVHLTHGAVLGLPAGDPLVGRVDTETRGVGHQGGVILEVLSAERTLRMMKLLLIPLSGPLLLRSRVKTQNSKKLYESGNVIILNILSFLTDM